MAFNDVGAFHDHGDVMRIHDMFASAWESIKDFPLFHASQIYNQIYSKYKTIILPNI